MQQRGGGCGGSRSVVGQAACWTTCCLCASPLRGRGEPDRRQTAAEQQSSSAAGSRDGAAETEQQQQQQQQRLNGPPAWSSQHSIAGQGRLPPPPAWVNEAQALADVLECAECTAANLRRRAHYRDWHHWHAGATGTGSRGPAYLPVSNWQQRPSVPLAFMPSLLPIPLRLGRCSQNAAWQRELVASTYLAAASALCLCCLRFLRRPRAQP